MFLYKHSVDNTWNWRVQKRRGWHFTLALWRIICGYPFLRNVGRLPLPCCIPEGVWKANNPSLLIVLAFLNKDLFYFGLVTADPAPCPDPWTRSWPDLFSFVVNSCGFFTAQGFLSSPNPCSWKFPRMENLQPLSHCLTTLTVKKIRFFLMHSIFILYITCFIIFILLYLSLFWESKIPDFLLNSCGVFLWKIKSVEGEKFKLVLLGRGRQISELIHGMRNRLEIEGKKQG